MRRRWPPLVALPFIARAVGLRILNPGATQPGLAPAVKVFRRGTATPVGITYATAPRLRDRMREGEVPDLLIAPVSMNDELVAAGRFTGERATLGRVGGSIIVRAGVPEPDKGDAAALAWRPRPRRPWVERYTSYAVALLPKSAAVAADLLRHLTGSEARTLMEAAG